MTTIAAPRRPDQLPPGRHKLSRDEVLTSQRVRMLTAVTEAVAEFGYHRVIINDVAQRAGVSRKTFYQHFPGGRDQCFLESYREHVVQAFAAPGPRRLKAFLEYFDGERAAARACLVETSSTADLRELRRATLAELFRFRAEARIAGVIGAMVELVDATLRRGDQLALLELKLQKIAEALR